MSVNRTVVLLAVLGFSLAQTACGQSRSPGAMMGGAMMGGGMMGPSTPPGSSTQALPDRRSEGAQMFSRYCSQCHALPAPSAHTADEWPGVVQRMQGHMVAQGKEPPDQKDLQLIVGYLQRHAK